MKKVEVDVLSSDSNSWVIKTPGRKYPAVVVQGDSLYHLKYLAQKIQELLNGADKEELRDYVEELNDLLAGRVTHYDDVLRESGFVPEL